MTTQEIIDDLRAWLPLNSTLNELIIRAADRLEELQFLLERKKIHSKDWEDQARQAKKERDEARAEVAQLKDAVAAYEQATVNQQLTVRPEPSRLEIAALLKAGWFANRDADFDRTDHKWWIELADALIKAAKEAK